MGIVASLVGHHMTTAAHMRLDDWQQIGRSGAGDVKGPRPAAFRMALYQSHHGVLVGIAAADRYAFLLADEGFVDFDDGAFSAHRCHAAPDGHCLPQSM